MFHLGLLDYISPVLVIANPHWMWNALGFEHVTWQSFLGNNSKYSSALRRKNILPYGIDMMREIHVFFIYQQLR